MASNVDRHNSTVREIETRKLSENEISLGDFLIHNSAYVVSITGIDFCFSDILTEIIREY
jgi:hypothetical protein